ncbi:hypothetical protein FQZ97_243870 [compost metagenome]
MLQGVAGGAGVEEGVQRVVIPLEQAFLRTGLQVRDVDLDGVALADAVETADALLQLVRMRRQVEQHQMVGELEVAAFAADFRADQHLRAEFLVGEVGRGAVALEDAHAFVEHRGRDAGAQAQGVFQVEGGFRVGADHQHLVLLEHLQGVDQPLDARVEAPPAGVLVAFLDLLLEAHFRIQVGVLADRQLHVFHRVRQRIAVQLALGEALHGGAGVAEQHAAGAVAVEQFADQARAGVFIAAFHGGQQFVAGGAEEAMDGRAGVRGEAAVVDQFLHGFGDRAVLAAFVAEGFQVVETVRIEQAQAREVAVQAKLFRRRGEQQDARDHLGQLFDQLIFAAGLFRMPDQVMGLVHHQQVPAGGEQGILGALVFPQPFQRHQGELAVLEGVAGVAFDEALAVEQRDFQVEAPAHFHQPLVLQVFRHQDQHAAGAAGEQLAMDHQAGLDGLAQAHFVGEQDARGDAVGHFAGDVQLVGDRLGAGAAKAPEGRLQQAGAVFQGVVAQAEPGQRVDLPGEQAVAGEAELNEVGQLGFRQYADFVVRVDAAVDQQAVGFLDLADGHLPAFEVGHLVAGSEAHAGQRGVAFGVLAGIAGRGIEHGEHPAIQRQDGSQPELGLTVADPALTRLILRHGHLPKKAGYGNGTRGFQRRLCTGRNVREPLRACR